MGLDLEVLLVRQPRVALRWVGPLVGRQIVPHGAVDGGRPGKSRLRRQNSRGSAGNHEPVLALLCLCLRQSKGLLLRLQCDLAQLRKRQALELLLPLFQSLVLDGELLQGGELAIPAAAGRHGCGLGGGPVSLGHPALILARELPKVLEEVRGSVLVSGRHDIVPAPLPPLAGLHIRGSPQLCRLRRLGKHGLTPLPALVRLRGRQDGQRGPDGSAHDAKNHLQIDRDLLLLLLRQGWRRRRDLLRLLHDLRANPEREGSGRRGIRHDPESQLPPPAPSSRPGRES